MTVTWREEIVVEHRLLPRFARQIQVRVGRIFLREPPPPEQSRNPLRSSLAATARNASQAETKDSSEGGEEREARAEEGKQGIRGKEAGKVNKKTWDEKSGRVRNSNKRRGEKKTTQRRAKQSSLRTKDAPQMTLIRVHCFAANGH